MTRRDTNRCQVRSPSAKPLDEAERVGSPAFALKSIVALGANALIDRGQQLRGGGGYQTVDGERRLFCNSRVIIIKVVADRRDGGWLTEHAELPQRMNHFRTAPDPAV